MNLDTFSTTSDADLDDIVRSLASMCLGMDAQRIPAEHALAERGGAALLTASVTISGAWQGAVAVSCSPGLAQRAASAMFGTGRQVAEEEATDALREIANIIGGNFKSLVSSPSRLSLPVLGDQLSDHGGPSPAHRLWFDCDGELLLVTVQAQPDLSGAESECSE